MKLYAPGAALGETFGTYAGATGASVAADPSPAPSASLVRNGVVDGAVTLTVAAVAGKTGIYYVSGTIPVGYAVGDIVDVVGTVVVGGQTVNIPVASFRLDQQVSVVEGLVNTLLTRLSSTRAANLDNLDALVSNVEAEAAAATVAASAAASSSTTILDRIGAFTGSGVNTILGFFRALLRTDATLPADVGGTFAATTDSLQAIRDRGDAAWGAGGSITPPVVYYQGNLTLTSDEPTVDGIIRRYAGDPLRIAVRLSTGEAPANIDGYTLVPVLRDSAGASAPGITADIALGPNGEATIDGTTPAATGIWRLTVRLDADGQTFGPLIVEVI